MNVYIDRSEYVDDYTVAYEIPGEWPVISDLRTAIDRSVFFELLGDYERFDRFANLYLRDYAPGRPREANLADEHDRLCKYLLFRTRNLLTANWQLVLTIADLLVDQGILTTDELARELGTARPEQAA